MSNNNENIVSSFFFYMWNTWCKEECQKVFGSMYEHFWSKWCSLANPSASGSSEKFYSALSEYNRRLLVNRACEVYDGAGLRRSQETTQIVYRCDECGSTDVQIKGWVKPNEDNQYVNDCEEYDRCWCEKCQTTVSVTPYNTSVEIADEWWAQCSGEDREIVSSLDESNFSTEQEDENTCDAIWNSKTDEEKIIIWNQIVNRKNNE